MTWLKFFAAPDDFPVLLERLVVPPCRAFEVYSEPGHKAREFTKPGQLGALRFGYDPGGLGVALHLALWSPDVMPRPTVRHIELRGSEFPPGSWREAVEGCGLFWLQTGGLHDRDIVASSLGWFTQKAALRQCSVQPGPKSVDWIAHESLAKSFKNLLRRELAVAHAGQHAVLSKALKCHREGARLIANLGIKQEFRVEAA